MTQAVDNPTATLLGVINGYQVSQALSVAARLRLPDLVDSTPRDAESIATAAGTHARATYRLLRALTSVGVFEETADHRFTANAASDLLRSDRTPSYRGWATFIGRPAHWRYWGDLENVVRTGEPAPSHLDGETVWEAREKDPEENAVFNAAMASLSGVSQQALATAFDFGRCQTIVDLGGGDGTLLIAILEQHPGPKGIVFDLPHVVREAEAKVEEAGLAGRLTLTGGNFFTEPVPPGADAYILKSVLHDCDDEESRGILSNVRDGMAPGGRILIIESVVAAERALRPVLFSDINMMVATGGCERTRAEWDALVESVGLRVAAVHPTASRFALIEVVRQ